MAIRRGQVKDAVGADEDSGAHVAYRYTPWYSVRVLVEGRLQPLGSLLKHVSARLKSRAYQQPSVVVLILSLSQQSSGPLGIARMSDQFTLRWYAIIP